MMEDEFSGERSVVPDDPSAADYEAAVRWFRSVAAIALVYGTAGVMLLPFGLLRFHHGAIPGDFRVPFFDEPVESTSAQCSGYSSPVCSGLVLRRSSSSAPLGLCGLTPGRSLCCACGPSEASSSEGAVHISMYVGCYPRGASNLRKFVASLIHWEVWPAGSSDWLWASRCSSSSASHTYERPWNEMAESPKNRESGIGQI